MLLKLEGNDIMDEKDFKDILLKYADAINIDLNNMQIIKLYQYMNLLIQWNQKVNLTSITKQMKLF